MKIGIVGLPNVGKSTLFNALTRARVAVADYPFTTINPNRGVVQVPDDRLEVLAGILKTSTIIPAIVEFVDIAGLVKGASHGEGLGNQFLSHIREVDAILHVVRCFDLDTAEDQAALRDPVEDFRTVELELILADLAHLEKRHGKVAKSAKSRTASLVAELDLIERVIEHLNLGLPASFFEADEDEKARLKFYGLLTLKPIMVVANVNDREAGQGAEKLAKLDAFFADRSIEVLPVVANLEADLSALDEEERQLFRQEFGLDQSSLHRIIRQAYRTLNLISFFTGNEKEARAWTLRQGATALEAAGTIHSDLERGFIRAEVIAFEKLAETGSLAAARDQGLIRSEGKSYLMQDGDYLRVRFNV